MSYMLKVKNYCPIDTLGRHSNELFCWKPMIFGSIHWNCRPSYIWTLRTKDEYTRGLFLFKGNLITYINLYRNIFQKDYKCVHIKEALFYSFRLFSSFKYFAKRLIRIICLLLNINEVGTEKRRKLCFIETFVRKLIVYVISSKKSRFQNNRWKMAFQRFNLKWFMCSECAKAQAGSTKFLHKIFSTKSYI